MLIAHEIMTPLHKPNYGFEQAFNRPPEVMYLDHFDDEIYQGPPQKTFAAAVASGSIRITVPSGSLALSGAAPLLPR